MMRAILAAVAAALALGAAGCPGRDAPPAGGRVPQTPSYEVRKDGKAVLTIKNEPGPIISMATLPPDSKPSTHPFLSATSHDAFSEDALRTILDQSMDFQDFVARLKTAGYEVGPPQAH